MNKRKGKLLKSFFFEEGEYERLKDAIEGNLKDEVLDIIFAVYNRGDFE